MLFYPLVDKSLASPEVRSLAGKSTVETTNVTTIAVGGISTTAALATAGQMGTTAPSNGRKVDAVVDATGDMRVRPMTDPPIELMPWSATLIGNGVREKTFRKTRVDNSEPAHNTCFLGSSATNRLTIAPAYLGSERSEPRQIFRV